MEGNYKLLRMTLAMFFSLLIVVPAVAQSASSSRLPVLEIVNTICLTGDCERHASRIYADGNLTIEAEIMKKAKSGQLRKVSTRVEMQLEAEELAEFIGLAEKADFLNASPQYVLKIMQDSPSWVTVIYRKKAQEKRVKVYSYLVASEAEKTRLPPSLLKMLELLERVLVN
jgi:hypothetical protein